MITTAYTYTASCSVICHVGATPVLVDTIPGSYDMDPEIREAVTERTKAVICVDLAGIIYPYYDKIYQIAEDAKSFFKPSGPVQEALGRIAVLADGVQAQPAKWKAEHSYLTESNMYCSWPVYF